MTNSGSDEIVQVLPQRATLPKHGSWSRSHMRSMGRLDSESSEQKKPVPTASNLNSIPVSPALKSSLEKMAAEYDRFKIPDNEKIGERERIINTYFGDNDGNRKNRDKLQAKNGNITKSPSPAVNGAGNELIENDAPSRPIQTEKKSTVANGAKNKKDPKKNVSSNARGSSPKKKKKRQKAKKLDKFGFIINLEGSEHLKRTKGITSSNTKSVTELRREKKWAEMMKNWNRTVSQVAKLKKRTRKGIPNAVRGSAWSMLGGAPDQINKKNKGKYQKLLRQATKQRVDQKHNNGVSEKGEVFKETIERDINRTFPTHHLFYDRPAKSNNKTSKDQSRQPAEKSSKIITDVKSALYGACTQDAANVVEINEKEDNEPDLINAKGGQAALRRVLVAYSVMDPKVGYCQGMNFISGMFLTYMSEEESFWLLDYVMNKAPCKMRGLFGDGMAEAQEILHIADRIFAQFLPKLYAHFERENVHISMYATQWLLTMYSSSFHFDLVTRVWDCFLYEGWKVAYRVMLALLTISQKELLSKRFEEVLGFLKDISNNIDGDAILDAALAIPLKTAHITKHRQDYLNTQNQ